MIRDDKPFLRPEQIDDLGLALITLAREMWVMKDRQIVLEALLEKHGLAEAVADHQPDAALTAKLAEERERFVKVFTGALLKASE